MRLICSRYAEPTPCPGTEVAVERILSRIESEFTTTLYLVFGELDETGRKE